MDERKQGSNPNIREIVWVRGETFKAESEVAGLCQPKWNENQTVLDAAILTLNRIAGPLEELRYCSEILGWGLQLTAERQTKGMWGRRSCWEMPVEESQAAMEARQYCLVTCRRWSYHHSLPFPTHQHWQLNNRGAGLWSIWCTKLQSRTPPRVLL